jgi:hypothetical protein
MYKPYRLQQAIDGGGTDCGSVANPGKVQRSVFPGRNYPATPSA